jgi:5'-phosphate synthase pdxT subunit
MLKIGVLALQGAFLEHSKKITKLGAQPIEIRQVKDLHKDLAGIILPGGESTTQGKMLRDLDLLEPLRERIKTGLPVLGTCAGLILLANKVTNDQTTHLATLPVSVTRNAYGRQLGSFMTDLDVKNIGTISATFIRAPYVNQISQEVEILASYQGKIVAVKYKNQIGLSFHPELNKDDSIHTYFLDFCQKN